MTNTVDSKAVASKAVDSTSAKSKPTRGLRARRTGVVTSDRGDKTIRVRHRFLVMHRKYGKYMRRFSNLVAHDEQNEAKMGDTVEIVACRRLSKTKCWRLTRIVAKA